MPAVHALDASDAPRFKQRNCMNHLRGREHEQNLRRPGAPRRRGQGRPSHIAAATVCRLSPSHSPMASPQSIEGANTRAMMLKEEGKLDEARDYLHHALNAARDSLMEDDPIFLSVLFNLSSLLQLTGKFEEAAPLVYEVLKCRTDAMGADHADTITCRHNLGTLLENLNRNEEALVERLAVVASRRKILGASHKDTLAALSSLGSTHLKLGQNDEALAVLAEELQGHVATYGRGCQKYLPADTIVLGRIVSEKLSALGKDKGADLPHYADYIKAWTAALVRDPSKEAALLSAQADPQPKLHPDGYRIHSGPFPEVDPVATPAVEIDDGYTPQRTQPPRPFAGARMTSENDEFKREVKRMVRATARNEAVPSGGSSGGGGGGDVAVRAVADGKNVSASTVPSGTFANASALLSPLGLEKYIVIFEEEVRDHFTPTAARAQTCQLTNVAPPPPSCPHALPPPCRRRWIPTRSSWCYSSKGGRLWTRRSRSSASSRWDTASRF